MAIILQSGYFYWDGFKYVLNPSLQPIIQNNFSNGYLRKNGTEYIIDDGYSNSGYLYWDGFTILS